MPYLSLFVFSLKIELFILVNRSKLNTRSIRDGQLVEV